MTRDNFFSTSIARSISDAGMLKDVVVSCLENMVVDNDILAQIELAMYEVLVNIIEHGESDQDDDTISLALSIDGDTLICHIEYMGGEFDITGYDLPDIPEHFKSGKKGGLGVYMVRMLVDKIDYSHDSGMNFLTLYKKIS